MTHDTTKLLSHCILCGCPFDNVHPKAPCPRCRARAAFSAPGRTLDESSLAYVRTVRRGWLLVMWGLVAIVALVIAAVVYDYTFLMIPVLWDPILDVAFLAAGLTAHALALVGWWLLSAPDPALANHRDGARTRRWMRVSVVLVALTALISEAIPYVISPPEPEDDVLALGITLMGFSFFSILCTLSLNLASFAVLVWLSTRLPSLKGYRRSRRGMFWLIACIPCAVVMVLAPITLLVGFHLIAVSQVVMSVALVATGFCALLALCYFLGAMRSVWLVLNPIYRNTLAKASTG